MNKNEWMDGLDNIDPDIIEQCTVKMEAAHKIRKKALYTRIAAIAACVCLIFVGITQHFVKGISIRIADNSTEYTQKAYGNSSSAEIDMYGDADIDTRGISVNSKYVDVLPDVYTFYADWEQTEFRLLRMEKLETLSGKNMPEEFYYIIPVEYMTDFSIYDQFVIRDMAQYAYDKTTVYNKTKNSPEVLELAVFGYYVLHFDFLGDWFDAYDVEGFRDTRLWTSTDAWIKSVGEFSANRTIEQAKKSASSGANYNRNSAKTLISLSGEAAEALEYMTSLENGIYAPLYTSGRMLYLFPDIQLGNIRYINNFATNEGIIIYDKGWNSENPEKYEIIYSKAQFTDDDLNRLPDLAAAVVSIAKEYDKGNIIPPHILHHRFLELKDYGIFGWYAKTPDGIIGIVRVTWEYDSDKLRNSYDDAYYIIEYGDKYCRRISRDALVKKLGEYETTHIYLGKYGLNGKVYDRYDY